MDTMRGSGSVRFRVPAPAAYGYLARTVLSHAIEPKSDELVDREATVLTRYRTKLWLMTVVTTEETTLKPGKSITWRHVDGPLTGSVEAERLD